MSELEVRFAGWFMCRLATDPDPSDEPRGVSGSTFALGEEPDLDRIVRLDAAPPGTQRSHGPAIGVRVSTAALNGVPVAALAGARLRLNGEPRFENRNFILTLAGREPIVPFDLSIEGDGVALRRGITIDPDRPNAPVASISREKLERFGAPGFRTDAAKVLTAAGIADPRADRAERRALLLGEHGRERDPLRRRTLEKRIAELDKALANPRDERIVAMRAIEEFAFGLNGEAAAHGLSGAVCDLTAPWPIEFWMGCWDADALSGYMSGTLRVPLTAVGRP
ncbi:MAG TPA: hypothetical protein VGX96_06610 [Candidatus Elarobacter sp.]|nr:hypothetical protein [Candidatus Elarobacter sp.]